MLGVGKPALSLVHLKRSCGKIWIRWGAYSASMRSPYSFHFREVHYCTSSVVASSGRGRVCSICYDDGRLGEHYRREEILEDSSQGVLFSFLEKFAAGRSVIEELGYS